MPLSKTVITFWLFFSTFLFYTITASFAQDPYKSRTHAVIPYRYKTVPAPPGMVYIHGGTTVIRYDQPSTDSNSARMVSLTSFFIDKTEVTNQQYRQFVEWVMDSIAIVKYLKDDKYFYEEETTPGSATSGSTTASTNTDNTNSLTKSNDTSASAFPPAVVGVDSATTSVTSASNTTGADTSGPADKRHINWSKVKHDKIWNPNNKDTYAKLAPMLDENGNVKKELLCFSHKYIRALSTVNNENKNKREVKTETLNIYPDETCWTQDLTNAQTEMYVENYFKAPPFDDYPVVGITWNQARAYSYWRSINASAYDYMPEYMKYYKLAYTLPSEAQWVYAAQGYYDMIVADDSADAANDTALNVVYPTDSTVTPHDSAWVANYIARYKQSTGDTAVAATDSAAVAGPSTVDSATAAAREQRKEERAARIAKKRADQRFNYYIADFLTVNKYGGRYGNINGSNNNTEYDPENPPIDSSAIHFDPNGMLSNFKQDEGDYWEDGSALTLPVMAYAPNEFGLYNMEGNVSEWVQDAYSPSTFSFVSDLNPVLLYDADSTDADAMKRKVVRGGSFMSNAKSLNPYYRDMELQNISHCFIGFRCVMQAPEVLLKNVSTRNRTMRGNPTQNKLYGARILPEIH